MNKIILFSPVGGTDPISLSNCHYGSMLHICRVYRPDRVILYMSQEVLAAQKEDNRYLYCLHELEKLQQRQMDCEIIERPELSEVQEFDYFYQEFREIIEKIIEGMDESDQLLLNVSSGTPAMKSGLLVLQTLGEFPSRAIQVLTPEKGMNTHIHKGYDVKILWELDEDNQPDFINRCREVSCPTLSAMKQEEIIKKHISVYDYEAARSVAQLIPASRSERYRGVLEAAANRLLLDFRSVDRFLVQDPCFAIPVREGNGRKSFEYALTLDIKYKRKEYGDFIRAITPLIVDLFEMILKKQCGIVVDDYCRETERGRQWDRRKLAGTPVLQVLEREFQDFKYGNVYSVHLLVLLRGFSNDAALLGCAEKLRGAEDGIRNLAAHEIVSVTDETIRQRTGMTSLQIMKEIKRAFSYTGIRITPEAWDSYDEMNQVILERIAH